MVRQEPLGAARVLFVVLRGYFEKEYQCRKGGEGIRKRQPDDRTPEGMLPRRTSRKLKNLKKLNK